MYMKFSSWGITLSVHLFSCPSVMTLCAGHICVILGNIFVKPCNLRARIVTVASCLTELWSFTVMISCPAHTLMTLLGIFNHIALRIAKTLWSFGHSECNRVKPCILTHSMEACKVQNDSSCFPELLPLFNQ